MIKIFWIFAQVTNLWYLTDARIYHNKMNECTLILMVFLFLNEFIGMQKYKETTEPGDRWGSSFLFARDNFVKHSVDIYFNTDPFPFESQQTGRWALSLDFTRLERKISTSRRKSTILWRIVAIKVSFVVDDRRHVRTRMMKSNETERERERVEGKKEGEREKEDEVEEEKRKLHNFGNFYFSSCRNFFVLTSHLFNRIPCCFRAASTQTVKLFCFLFFSFSLSIHLSCVAACYNRAFAHHSFIVFFF